MRHRRAARAGAARTIQYCLTRHTKRRADGGRRRDLTHHPPCLILTHHLCGLSQPRLRRMGGADADSHSAARVESARRCARTCGSCLAVEGGAGRPDAAHSEPVWTSSRIPGRLSPARGTFLGTFLSWRALTFCCPLGMCVHAPFFFSFTGSPLACIALIVPVCALIFSLKSDTSFFPTSKLVHRTLIVQALLCQ